MYIEGTWGLAGREHTSRAIAAVVLITGGGGDWSADIALELAFWTTELLQLSRDQSRSPALEQEWLWALKAAAARVMYGDGGSCRTSICTDSAADGRRIDGAKNMGQPD